MLIVEKLDLTSGCPANFADPLHAGGGRGMLPIFKFAAACSSGLLGLGIG
jgi:hypothetical protein